MEYIEVRIAQLQGERRSVETELERVTETVERLPAVRNRIDGLETELAEFREEREALAAREEGSDGRERLSDARARREQLRNQRTALRNKIERQEDRLQRRRAELDELDLPEEPASTGDLEGKRTRIAELETNVNLLEDLHRVNKRVLDEGKAEWVTEVERTLGGDEFSCWICGESASEPELSRRIDGIRDRIRGLREEKSDIRDEIESRRDERRRRKRRKRELTDEIGELEVTIEENRSRLSNLDERLSGVTNRLETVREEVAAATDRATDVESQIKYKRSELEDERETLAEFEADAERKETLQGEYETLTAEIESLRARRKEKKRELADRFARAMGEVVETFELGVETARLTPKTDGEGRIVDFDLVVARDGRETSLDALSEGEVELLGIVTAIAGYETFDVGGTVPVLGLDGLTSPRTPTSTPSSSTCARRPTVW